MPAETEVDFAFTGETLDFDDFETRNETGEENVAEEERQNDFTNDNRQQDQGAEEGGAGDRGLLAVMDQKGGRSEDWQFVDRGDAGYRFDGSDIRDPDGAIWNNPDAALHADMLAAWREGDSATFLLPDYTERTDEKETLYITTLELDKETGNVSWSIHAHETILPKDDESVVNAPTERATESYAVRWDENFENDAAKDDVEQALNAALAAEEAQRVETEDAENTEVFHTTDDASLHALLAEILTADRLENSGSPLENTRRKSPVSEASPIDAVTADTREHASTSSVPQVPEIEMHEQRTDTILRALGLGPVLSPYVIDNIPGSVPAKGSRPITGIRLRERAPHNRPGTGSTLNGIRMERAA